MNKQTLKTSVTLSEIASHERFSLTVIIFYASLVRLLLREELCDVWKQVCLFVVLLTSSPPQHFHRVSLFGGLVKPPGQLLSDRALSLNTSTSGGFYTLLQGY